MPQKINKLVLIGPYPPPYGGISIHLKRLKKKLDEQNIKHIVYNHYSYANSDIVATNKSFKWYLYFLFTFNKIDIIHFHQFSFFHYIYYYIFSILRNNRIFITIHEENIFHYNVFKRFITLLLLSRTKYIKLFCVSKKLTDFLVRRKIEAYFLPAYIKPAADYNKKKLNLPYDSFFIFSMWKLESKIAYNVYGFDMLEKLMSDRPLNLLLMIGSHIESDRRMAKKIKEKYRNRVTILYENDLVEYLPHAKFLLRCNSIDGYGVSLEESVQLGTPAIATDVCIRPDGVFLYKYGEYNEMLKIINLVLENKHNMGQYANNDCSFTLIDEYRKALVVE